MGAALAASLPPTRWQQHPLPSCDNQKCSQTSSDVSWGAKSPQLRTSELQVTGRKIFPWRGLIQRLSPEKVPRSLWQEQQNHPALIQIPRKLWWCKCPQEPLSDQCVAFSYVQGPGSPTVLLAWSLMLSFTNVGSDSTSKISTQLKARGKGFQLCLDLFKITEL